MSTVLAYTSPAIGHLFPMVPILLELHRRGHDVHVRTLGDHVHALRALGLQAEPADPRSLAITHPDWEAHNPKQALEVAVRTFAERALVDGPDFEQALADVRPDAVVVDINAWGALVAAEAWAGPWVTFSPFTPPIRSVGAPPFGPGFLPRHDLVGRLRDALARPLVQGAAERTMTPRINALRAGRGLTSVSGADEFFRKAPTLLVTTSEPFEYPHQDWDDVRMIGALSWEPPLAAPAWLEEIEGPIALVTTSSEYQADEALVRAALEGLADEPFTVVATMPAGVDGGLRVPANARVVDFVPHGAVLDRTVVAITHGGMGATQKALARGIPVCVVPFGRDQLEVAARVVTADCGTKLPAKRLTAESLRDAVRTALTKRAGAQLVAEGYAGAGGAAAGATAVEELLRPAPARST